jgi:hypothetical protein
VRTDEVEEVKKEEVGAATAPVPLPLENKVEPSFLAIPATDIVLNTPYLVGILVRGGKISEVFMFPRNTTAPNMRL